MAPIEFRSDNTAAVAPAILAAVVAANTGSAIAYGADALTARLQETVRAVFEHPGARVFPVASGTAANALALSAMCPPWGAVLCHETAHILNSEAAATSMMGGGLLLRGVGGDDYRMQPATLADAFAATRWSDNHHSQPRVISFTQPTDMGTVYRAEEVGALTAAARARGLRAHLDGARIANAIAALGCRPADLTWRAGIDVVSLGATKNGALSAEAIVSFDDAVSDELVYRTKRAGHVTSKMRFQSAQLVAYLTGDLWLRLAARSNERMRQLSDGLRGLGVGFLNRPDVNMLFAQVGDDAATGLERAGLLFYRIRPGVIRLVTSWQTSEEEVDRALAAFARALR
jgi:threonine aldolase